MLVNTQNFSVKTICSVIVRSCNVSPLVIRGPFLSGLALSVDPLFLHTHTTNVEAIATSTLVHNTTLGLSSQKQLLGPK